MKDEAPFLDYAPGLYSSMSDQQMDNINRPAVNYPQSFKYCTSKNHGQHARNHAAMNVPKGDIESATLMKK